MKIRKATKKDAERISGMRRKTIKIVNSKDYPKEVTNWMYLKNSTENIIENENYDYKKRF